MHFSYNELFQYILNLLCDFLRKVCQIKVGVFFLDGSMLSVRVCTQRMRWNKLLMKALPVLPASHMFQNLWVSENDVHMYIHMNVHTAF